MERVANTANGAEPKGSGGARQAGRKPPAKAVRKIVTRSKPGASAGTRTVAQSVTAPKKNFTPTATSVARLRKRLEMNRSQFAELLGVSQPAVANWESKNGRLNLQQRTMQALSQAAELTKAQAWERLNG